MNLKQTACINEIKTNPYFLLSSRVLNGLIQRFFFFSFITSVEGENRTNIHEE